MKTLPLSEAKTRFSELVSQVERRQERVTVTKNGRASAVLISAADLESLEATLEIMADPDFYAEILRNRRALDEGRGREYTLDELFGPEGGSDVETTGARRGRRQRRATPARTKESRSGGTRRPRAGGTRRRTAAR